jgi:hypothetical protein
MDLVRRARNIIVRPASEWAAIDAEPSSVGDLYTQYLMPLGLIGPIASFIGLTVIGVSIPFIGTYRTPLTSGIASAITSFAAILVGAYIWSLIIDALAPTFGGRRSNVAALKVAVFAATPALLAGILSLLPALGMLQLLAALYGLYLLYRGLPVLMKTPPANALPYTAATVVSGILVGIVLGAIMVALHFTPLFGHAPQMSRESSDAAAQGAIASVVGAAAGGTDDGKAAAQSIAAGIVAAGKAAEAQTSAAPGAAPAPGTPAQPATDDQKQAGAAVAAGVAALGAFVGGGKPHVATVDFHRLEALLPPSVGSLARTNRSGQHTAAAGLGVSQAEGTYGASGSGTDLTIKITDMGNAGGVMAIGKLALATESESDNGYEKNVVLRDQKVHEKWTAAAKTSELTAFVGDRFMVEIDGAGVDMPVAENALESLDLSELAALKG